MFDLIALPSECSMSRIWRKNWEDSQRNKTEYANVKVGVELRLSTCGMRDAIGNPSRSLAG